MNVRMMSVVVFAAAWFAGAARADEARIAVDGARAGAAVAPTMYGIFFEEINHGAEGGLYAEMLQNRSFEETVPIEGTRLENRECVADGSPHYLTGRNKRWTMPWRFPSPWPAWSLEPKGAKASLDLRQDSPVHPANVNYLRLTVDAAGPDAEVRLLNDGFWGVAVRQGETYRLSFFARGGAGFGGRLRAGLVAGDGRTLAEATVDGIASGGWKKYEAALPSSGTDRKARFFLQPLSAGAVDLDVVSLFPAKTFKDRPNGLRPDIAQLLADLQPAFMRFPGGCYVEGATFANRYRWKETIGPVEARPGHWCLWNYRSTDGMGYHEFLELCEDIGCAALYVANAGLGCEFRHGDFLPEERIDEMTRDALDAIEYALGPADSKWGRVRAENGHPAPFPLRYVQIGNENHGPRYIRNYNRMYAALKKAWPDLAYVFCCGTGWATPPNVAGAEKIEIADEHFYRNPDWMFDQFRRYDTESRDRGFHLYVGEYACNQDVGSGNHLAALSEAAFMMGMERNGDLVRMTSYAPLFFNVNRLDWPVNLIGFDNAVSFGRSSYHVQKLFAVHRPDVNLATEFKVATPAAAPSEPHFAGGIGLGTWKTQAQFKDIRVEQDGRVVYASDFNKGDGEWTPCWGVWSAAGGAYVQTEHTGERKIALLNSFTGGAYTVSMKARKIAGEEGFLIPFAVRDRDHYHQFNVGGWGNQGHAFERIARGRQQTITPQVAGRVDEGRWYEIRLVVAADRVEGWLDGKKVGEVRPTASEPRFYGLAGYDRKAGEVVIKALNARAEPARTQFELAGFKSIERAGRRITLEGDPQAENTVEHPSRIEPKETAFDGFGERFTAELPPWSFTVLRVKAER